jgi:hypothetical protein
LTLTKRYHDYPVFPNQAVVAKGNTTTDGFNRVANPGAAPVLQLAMRNRQKSEWLGGFGVSRCDRFPVA